MTVSNISSKATEPIVTKSHLEPPGADGTKNCSNRIVHMTNIATTPLYGKIHQNSSTPEPVDRWSCNLV